MRLFSETKRSRQEGAQAGKGVQVTLTELVGLRRSAPALGAGGPPSRAPQGGLRPAPFKGRGMEYDETRPYHPGDDVRHLDWRVTARTGKAHTKLFREERERPVMLWVDYRASMFFATRGVYKSVLAARTVALLAWDALRQGDKVGAQVLDGPVPRLLRPRRTRRGVLELLQQLTEVPRTPMAGDAAPALGRLRSVVRPGGRVILLSDFRRLGAGAEAQLVRLARHSEVVLFFIYDPLEAELPPAGRYRLSDGAREQLLDSTDPLLAARHHNRFVERRQSLERLAGSHGMHLLCCATTDDPAAVLRRGLGERRR